MSIPNPGIQPNDEISNANQKFLTSVIDEQFEMQNVFAGKVENALVPEPLVQMAFCHCFSLQINWNNDILIPELGLDISDKISTESKRGMKKAESPNNFFDQY